MRLKVHRIGTTKAPREYQVIKMAENLRHRLGTAVFITNQYYVNLSGTNYTKRYSLTLVPGLNGEEGVQYTKDSWAELLKLYRKLMKLGKEFKDGRNTD
jgi:hypothetical protein